MKYRAKITRIMSSLETIYSLKGRTCQDLKDVYIEVDTPEEADLIECMNMLQFELDKLRIKLICLKPNND